MKKNDECQNCDSEAEFVCEEGKKVLYFCEHCIKEILLEEAISNNDVFDLDYFGEEMNNEK